LVPGQIILDSDTMNVTIRLLQSRETLAIMPLQSEVQYIDDNGNPHKTDPSKAKEIRFRYGDDDVRMVSKMFMTPEGNADIKFLKLALEGPVSVFEYYVPSQRISPADKYQKSVIPLRIDYGFQKGEKGELKFCNADVRFKKDMAKYFRDCPALEKWIAHGDLKSTDHFEIARFYNSRCN